TYFAFQSTFMIDKNTGLETLKDIRQMMEKSSRFISLSGLSGIGAGICALAGAWFANNAVMDYGNGGSYRLTENSTDTAAVKNIIKSDLFTIALLTLVSAIIMAIIFTWLKSKKY